MLYQLPNIMYHGVVATEQKVNTMDQDVLLGVTTTVTQADLPYLREAGRLGEYAVVYRVSRNQLGGGFGDQDKHPFAWGVLVYVDAQLGRLYSARGAGREWNSLDRLERWLRDQGFLYWWTRNDHDPQCANQDSEEDEEDTPSLGPFPPGDLLPPGPTGGFDGAD